VTRSVRRNAGAGAEYSPRADRILRRSVGRAAATRDGVGRYDSVMMRDGNLVVKDFPITDCNATNDYTIG